MSNEEKTLRAKLPIWKILSLVTAVSAVVVAFLVWRLPRQERDFTLSVTPMQGTILQGAVTQTTIYVRGQGGYKHAVSLSATGQPSDVLIAFSPPSGAAAPAYNSTMTVNVGGTVPAGDCTITIRGTGADGMEHTCKYVLSVTAKQTSTTIKIPKVTITTPTNDQEVPMSSTLSGTISGDLPEGHYMWVVINPHTSPGEWWPQGGRIEPWSGRWNAPVVLGREQEDIGISFDIAVILLNEEDHNKYEAYLEEGARTGNYPGKSLPRSTLIIQRITVKRK